MFRKGTQLFIAATFLAVVQESAAERSARKADASWWSLQPVNRPTPPDPEGATAWARNPIDAFIFSTLKANGLAPSPEADRRTLIRRVTFDLTGLPPTPEEIDGFLKDDRPDAYEKLVDHLLKSEHYGERWARHWLDVVRFGESHGFEYNQPRENAWHYRNWVVDGC